MLLKIILLIAYVAVIDAAHQQCNIICQDDQQQSSQVTNNMMRRGKAGPKGDKGDSCECSLLDQVLEEMDIIKAQLAGLQRKPRDCYEIKVRNPNAVDGIYQIYPSFNETDGYQVYCDMKAGGWIVFQNRQDGSEDFYRNWYDYVHGFGSLTGEFWMGLELLHKLTANTTMELRIDLADFENNTAYEQYSEFSIGDGTDYTLDFGTYTGTAGQSLLKGKFTTKDNDQDTYTGNCADLYFGGWWYQKCHLSNLNGLYLHGHTDRYAAGMVWKTWKGYHYALKNSQMKFRPSI